jgi:hypothetical protein
MRPLHLNLFTHNFLGDCNYYYAFDSQLSQGLTVDKKNAHLRGTAANIIKPTQTGINRNKYTFCTMKSSETLKIFKTSRIPYLRLVNVCQNFEIYGIS